MKTTQRTTGWYHVMAAVTVMIWGTTFVATKVLIKYGLSPVDILFYRFLLAYICIWFFSPRVLLAKSWQDELRFVGLGLCGGSLYFVAENTALGMTLASNVSLIICTTPILTALLAPFFYKGDKLKARLIGGSLMALIGVGLVVFNGSFILQLSPVGDILTLIAALMWAFYCLLLRRMNTHYPTLFITRKVFFYGLVTLLPLFLVYPLQTDIHILFRTRCRSKSAFSGGDCLDAVLYYVEYGSETIGSGLCHQLYLCSSPYYFADLCHCDRRNHHNSCFIGIGTDSERSVYCRKGSELEEINSVGNCFNFLSLRFSMKFSLWLHSTLFQEELH